MEIVMKNFDYYSNPVGVEHFGYEVEKGIKEKLKAEIDETPMTATRRQERLKEMPKLVRDEMARLNKPYREAQGVLETEFWADCRADLGYESYLTEEGVSKLEGLAYEEGHAYGHSSVYSKLQDLEYFARMMIAHRKT